MNLNLLTSHPSTNRLPPDLIKNKEYVEWLDMDYNHGRIEVRYACINNVDWEYLFNIYILPGAINDLDIISIERLGTDKNTYATLSPFNYNACYCAHYKITFSDGYQFGFRMVTHQTEFKPVGHKTRVRYNDNVYVSLPDNNTYQVYSKHTEDTYVLAASVGWDSFTETASWHYGFGNSHSFPSACYSLLTTKNTSTYFYEKHTIKNGEYIIGTVVFFGSLTQLSYDDTIKHVQVNDLKVYYHSYYRGHALYQFAPVLTIKYESSGSKSAIFITSSCGPDTFTRTVSTTANTILKVTYPYYLSFSINGNNQFPLKRLTFDGQSAVLDIPKELLDIDLDFDKMPLNPNAK